MHDDIKWIFGILVVLGVFWFVSGGIFRDTSTQPFVLPLSETGGTVQTYGVNNTNNYNAGTPGYGINASQGNTPKTPEQIRIELEQAQQEAAKLQEQLKQNREKNGISDLEGQLAIQSVSAGYSGNPANEYVIIGANPSNPAKIKITGVTLLSAMTGQQVTISTGVYLPYTGVVNASDDIYLNPGETAYIITGRSPLGISFKTNKCIGYLSQFQSFSPSLPTSCPRPIDEPLPQYPNQLNDRCLDFIASMGSCKTMTNPPTDLNTGLTHECQEHIIKEIGYNKCIGFHKNEPDFYRKDWRIYLARDQNIWKTRREMIQLLDENRRLISTYTY